MNVQSTEAVNSLNGNLNSRFWKITFFIAGIYTSGSVIPGILNPADALLDFTNQKIDDWNTLYFFRSLWITVFVFGIGFLVAAQKPFRHIGIAIMGLLGKLFFASQVLFQYSNQKVSQIALTAASVDLFFVLLFGIFIYKYLD